MGGRGKKGGWNEMMSRKRDLFSRVILSYDVDGRESTQRKWKEKILERGSLSLFLFEKPLYQGNESQGEEKVHRYQKGDWANEREREWINQRWREGNLSWLRKRRERETRTLEWLLGKTWGSFIWWFQKKGKKSDASEERKRERKSEQMRRKRKKRKRRERDETSGK